MKNKFSPLIIALTLSTLVLSGCGLIDKYIKNNVLEARENVAEKVDATKAKVKAAKENIEQTVEDVKETAESIQQAAESVKKAKEDIDAAFGNVKSIGKEEEEEDVSQQE